MIISCPSCGASFNVQPEALGPAGRTVKCSKCAYRWRALPDGTAEEEPAAEGLGLPPDAAPGAPDPAAPVAASSAQDPGALAEQLRESDRAAESEPPAGGTDSPPAPSFRLREALGVGEDDAADDDAGDAETTSRADRKRRSPARKPRGSSAKVISLFALVLLIAGLVSVGTLMKQEVMMWLPATQRLYAMIGVEPDFLGRGLQIIEPKPKKEIDGNDEILVVEGEVRNTANEAVDVPLMRGALLDKAGKELHIWTFTAAKPRIAPGEAARYRTEFRNPPAAAESLDITFTRTDSRMETATQEVNVQGVNAPTAPASR